ncbi:MAG: DUF1338 domain-containing protein [Gammaproteobacteria bacterium]|nr:DUF1338 domain-containing protein [Gammaproteobacteria bacterium]
MTMDRKQFFSRLWSEYLAVTPQAEKIMDLFLKHNQRVVNDHIALRTFDIAPIDIAHLEPFILGIGYRPLESYEFPIKHLKARSYLGPDSDDPRIFISQLITETLSKPNQQIVNGLCNQIKTEETDNIEVFTKGRLWAMPDWDQYNQLLEESEYAAWLSAMGLRANHFTISINHLDQTNTLESANRLLKQAGFKLNTRGGEIKGSSEALLEQSSTMADKISLPFGDGKVHEISSCYYEFARRYKTTDDQLFQGFVASSADKIFESTDRT